MGTKSWLHNTYFWLLTWIVWMGVIFYFSHMPGNPTYYDPTIKILVERKGAHVVEYAVLFLLSVQVFSLLFSKESLRRIVFLALAWSVTYGILDELHQFFTPFRGSSVVDVAIDGIGIFLALFLVLVVSLLQRKKSSL